MKQILLILSSFIMLSVSATAQENAVRSIENPQPIQQPKLTIPPQNMSLKYSPYKLATPEIKVTNLSKSLIDSIDYNPINDYKVKADVYPQEQPYKWHYNIFSHDYSKYGKIRSWDRGFVYGASSYTTMPLMGSVGSAEVGISQMLDDDGRWVFTGGVSAEKYNFSRENYNTFGVNGSVTFNMNRNIKFCAFGNYQTNAIFNSMAAMPYVSQSNYGAYMSVLTNNQKWGVDMGARRYYDPYARQWVTMPIVMPYYNLQGQKLGIDFGGILYQIFHSLSVKSNGGYRYEPGTSAPGNMNIPHGPNMDKAGMCIPRNFPR